MAQPRVKLYYNPDLSRYCLGADHPMVPRRLHLVQRLLKHFGLLEHLELVEDYEPSTAEELMQFHTPEYVAMLQFIEQLGPVPLTPELAKKLGVAEDLKLFGMSAARGAADQPHPPAGQSASAEDHSEGSTAEPGPSREPAPARGARGCGTAAAQQQQAADDSAKRRKTQPNGGPRGASAPGGKEPVVTAVCGSSSDTDSDDEDEDEGSDCPVFPGILRYVGLQAAGSILGARDLASGACDIAIHWGGGMHHGVPHRAFGFCYVNDLVLATLELLHTFQRVLYIDIDVHHGDGVEHAFKRSNQVMTISLHKWDDGKTMASMDVINHGSQKRAPFFPGTGAKGDVGEGKGQYFSVNVPLQNNIDDISYMDVFNRVVEAAFVNFRPQAVILQCGCDSVAGDKLGRFNLSIRGHAACVNTVRRLCMHPPPPPKGVDLGRGRAAATAAAAAAEEPPARIPLLVTGGGGYTVPLVARCWTYETAVLLGRPLKPAMPGSVLYDAQLAEDIADLMADYYSDGEAEDGGTLDCDAAVDALAPGCSAAAAPGASAADGDGGAAGGSAGADGQQVQGPSMRLDARKKLTANPKVDSDRILDRLASHCVTNIQQVTRRLPNDDPDDDSTSSEEDDEDGGEGKQGRRRGPLAQLLPFEEFPDPDEYYEVQMERREEGAPWTKFLPAADDGTAQKREHEQVVRQYTERQRKRQLDEAWLLHSTMPAVGHV